MNKFKRWIIYQLTKFISRIIEIDKVVDHKLWEACETFGNDYRQQK